jgi:hypothetical protein
MAKHISGLGFWARIVTAQEAHVMVASIAVIVSLLILSFHGSDLWFWLFLAVFVIACEMFWVKANAGKRIEAEIKQALPSWKERRFDAALHIRGNYKSGMYPFPGDPTPLKRSEDIEFMLNRLEEICVYDSRGLLDDSFFREYCWPLLKFYWLYTHALIIDEQKSDPAKWVHIFTTFNKYRTVFGITQEDIFYQKPQGMVLQGELLRRELNTTDPDGNSY